MSKDTNYLRSDIEFNRLNDDRSLTLAANTTPITGGTGVKLSTTGNGVAYLTGDLEATLLIAAGTLLATLPTGINAKTAGIYNMSVDKGGGVIGNFSVKIVNNQILAHEDLALGYLLHFYGVIFLTT